MNKKEEQELNERLNRIEQHERLRKAEGKEQYKDTSKGDRVIVYTNDKFYPQLQFPRKLN